MKKIILFISLLFCMAVHAQEEEECCIYDKNFYARIFSGPNFLQSTTIEGNKSTYETGYIVDGSLGFSWSRYALRLEAEYAYRRNGIEKINFFVGGFSEHGYFENSSCMANLLWAYPFWKIQPFIGAGIGCDFQHMRASNSQIAFNQRWNNFSAQVMAGLSCPIFRNTELTLEYKFHQGGRFCNHSVGLGLVYNFGFLR